MMVLGMSAWLTREYEIISNREAGSGRCDIILKGKKALLSYVMEFKYRKDRKELEKAADEAVKQIIEKGYDKNLKGEIVYIGLAHCGKEVEVKWMEK